MFPQTGHVETVVLLSQQKPSDKIEVDLDLDELDVTSAETKATYAEIKVYVLKENGLKVSNLYISRIKRKCGIEVGENYNLAKSEDVNQPNCPEEKNGIDPSKVVGSPPPNKGYGNSTTIPFDVSNAKDAKLVLLSLADTVCSRLRTDSVRVLVVSVSITYYDFTHESHQATLFSPTNVTNEIYATACILFDEMWRGRPIRQLGIHTQKTKEDDGLDQLNIFNINTLEKQIKWDKTVDKIRCRYGNDSVMRACFISGPVHNMIGGISKEKLSINYEEEVVT